MARREVWSSGLVLGSDDPRERQKAAALVGTARRKE
jgi:hypothetical protein